MRGSGRRIEFDPNQTLAIIAGLSGWNDHTSRISKLAVREDFGYLHAVANRKLSHAAHSTAHEKARHEGRVG